jgi:hypothetical protein
LLLLLLFGFVVRILRSLNWILNLSSVQQSEASSDKNNGNGIFCCAHKATPH